MALFIYSVTLLMGMNCYRSFFPEFSPAEALALLAYWVCLHWAFWFVLDPGETFKPDISACGKCDGTDITHGSLKHKCLREVLYSGFSKKYKYVFNFPLKLRLSALSKCPAGRRPVGCGCATCGVARSAVGDVPFSIFSGSKGCSRRLGWVLEMVSSTS